MINLEFLRNKWQTVEGESNENYSNNRIFVNLMRSFFSGCNNINRHISKEHVEIMSYDLNMVWKSCINLISRDAS